VKEGEFATFDHDSAGPLLNEFPSRASAAGHSSDFRDYLVQFWQSRLDIDVCVCFDRSDQKFLDGVPILRRMETRRSEPCNRTLTGLVCSVEIILGRRLFVCIMTLRHAWMENRLETTIRLYGEYGMALGGGLPFISDLRG